MSQSPRAQPDIDLQLANTAATRIRENRLSRNNACVLESSQILTAYRFIGGADGISEEKLRDAISKVFNVQLRKQAEAQLHDLFLQYDPLQEGTIGMLEFQNMLRNSSILEAAVHEYLQKVDKEDVEREENRIKESKADMIIGAIVMLNAVTMALGTDLYPDWLGWKLIEACFVLCFSIEIVFKIWTAGTKATQTSEVSPTVRYFGRLLKRGLCDYLKQGINVFDFIITLLAIIDVACLLFQIDAGPLNQLTLLRLVRMARFTRLLKVFQAFQELALLASCMVSSMRTLLWSILLLALILLVPSIILRQAIMNGSVPEEMEETFPNVGGSMLVFFRCLVIGADGACQTRSGEPIYNVLSDTMGILFHIMWVLVEILVILCLLNVVASVFFVQAVDNRQEIDWMMQQRRRTDDSKKIDSLENLLRTLAHPQRKGMKPKEQQASNVTRYIQIKHPDAAAKIPDLSQAVLEFAEEIQGSKETYTQAMDQYQADDNEASQALLNMPPLQLFGSGDAERLCVPEDYSQMFLTGQSKILESSGITIGSGEEALLLQESENLVQLLEEAAEVRAFMKSKFEEPSSTRSASRQRLDQVKRGGASNNTSLAPAEILDPGVKSAQRIKEKVRGKYAGRYERNRDYCRFSFVYNAIGQLQRDLSALLRHRIDKHGFEVVRVENRFLEPTALGWRDVTLLLRVKVPSSGRRHIMELQMQLRGLMEVRKEGHGFYEKIRTLLPDAAINIIIDQLTIDTTLDLAITKKEWKECLQNKEVSRILDELHVPRSVRPSIVDVLDSDCSGTVTAAELREGLLQCKGPCLAKDLVECRIKMNDIQMWMRTHLDSQVLILQDMVMGMREIGLMSGHVQVTPNGTNCQPLVQV